MKKLFFTASFMIVGLLQVGMSLAHNNDSAGWKHTGPTDEDFRAANQIENLAVKGSREDQLINAAKNGDLKKVETFIAAGTGLEARDDQDRTALMRAAEKGYFDVVRILLDAGADVHTKDKFGWTALFMAADKNHVEVVKILIARGAASDKNFNDIFVSSVFKGKTAMVKALVGEGANISCKTIDEAYSVLRYGNTEMVNLINHLKSKCDSSN